MSSYCPLVDRCSRATSISELDSLCGPVSAAPSPQAWLASSKKRASGPLDPPGSPLELLSPIKTALGTGQWHKRMSLLTHRYLREYGGGRDEEIVDKAFRTLGLFCVGDEARESLESFKTTFAKLSCSSEEQISPGLTSELSRSWISFPSFLDDSFNLSRSSIALSQQEHSMGTLQDITSSVTNRQQQPLPHHGGQHNAFQSPSTAVDENSPFSANTVSSRAKPRYMTPTLASRGQLSKVGRPVTPQSRTLTPTSALTTSSGRRKGWMVNASRKLGINRPGSRTERGLSKDHLQEEESRTTFKTNADRETMHNEPCQFRSVKAVTLAERRKDNSQTKFGPQVPPKAQIVPSAPERKHNPPNKPLPSLPIATVQHGSPIVRRSLIGASERPLRASLTPSPAVNEVEEWPAIPPSRPFSRENLQQPAQKVPEEPETERVDGVEQSQVNLREPSNTTVQRTEFESIEAAPHTETLATCDFIFQSKSDSCPGPNVAESEHTTECGAAPDSHGTLNLLGSSTLSQDMSAGAAAIEKFMDGQRPLPNGEVRQTKTSSMRARLSGGSIQSVEVMSKARHQVATCRRFSPPRDQSKAKATYVRKRVSIPGPVRTPLQGRKAANVKSSPYGSSIRPRTHAVNLAGHDKAYHEALACPSQPLSSSNSNAPHCSVGVYAVKETKAQKGDDRTSFIPRPRHVVRSHVREESEAEILIARPKRKTDHSNKIEEEYLREDADIDTDHDDETNNSTADCSRENGSENEAKPPASGHDRDQLVIASSPGLSASSSPPRPVADTLYGSSDFSPIASNESGVESLRAFDGSDRTRYRLRHLSVTAPEHGPTLRISTAAEEIIMGGSSDKQDEESDTHSKKRNSVPDLRRSVVIKEQIRRSTEGLLRGHLPISRSMTSRSLSKLSREEAEVSLYGRDDASLKKADASLKNSSGMSGATTEDPFVDKSGKIASIVESRGGLPRYDSDWPLNRAERCQKDLMPVVEQLSKEEKSWISPLSVLVEHPYTSDDQMGPSLRQAADNSLWPTPISVQSQPHEPASPDDKDGISPTEKCNFAQNLPDCTSHISGRSSPSPQQTFPGTQADGTMAKCSLEGKSTTDQTAPTEEIPNRFMSVRHVHHTNELSMPGNATNHSGTLRTVHAKPTTADYLISTAYKTSRPLQSHETDISQTTKPHVSGSKRMLSNFRGLFNKRSTESVTPGVQHKPLNFGRDKNGFVSRNGSPFSPLSAPLPSYASSRGGPGLNVPDVTTPLAPTAMDNLDTSTPAIESPDPDEMQKATCLAMAILDRARDETDAVKKSKLLEVGRIMVEAVTAARDGEKAMEEAKQAAARAEINCVKTIKAVAELANLVGQVL